MSAIYTAGLNRGVDDGEYLRQLFSALIENGVYHEAQIKVGLAWARNSRSDFMPNPGKFARACLGSYKELGLPSADEAFEEASREAGKLAQYRKYSHAAVCLAAQKVGFTVLRTAQTQTEQAAARRRYVDEYLFLCDQVLRGEVLVAPEAERIENTKRTPAPPPKGLLTGLIDKL